MLVHAVRKGPTQKLHYVMKDGSRFFQACTLEEIQPKDVVQVQHQHIKCSECREKLTG